MSTSRSNFQPSYTRNPATLPTCDANTFDYHESEFYLAEVHWLRLDMPSVRTKGVLLDKVDPSKVDAVGFADLTPGSGHGSGGYSDVAWIEVYGKPMKRDAVTGSK